jgi:mRNA interferase RelE/StbE
VKVRILNKLRELSVDPLAHARKLSDQRIGTFRLRIGDYRVVFDYLDDKVVVLRVGDRKDIY